ncbi:MAG: PEGA domain-containing protein, partial [Acidobacteriota bacterium]
QGLRGWLARALQLDQRRPFLTVREAQGALDQVLASDARYVVSTVAVEAFISRCVDSIIEGTSSVAQAPPPLPVTPVQPAMPLSQAPPLAAPVLKVPEVPSPVRAPEPPRPPEAPHPFELPRVAEPPRAIESPVPPPEPPMPPPVRKLNAPDFEELQRTFAASDVSSVFSEEPHLEEQASAPAFSSPKKPRRWMRSAAIIVALVALAAGGTYAGRKYLFAASNTPAADTGTLVVQSTPAGVEVVVDGVAHGVTPARLTLKVGPHILELRGKGLPRVMPLTMTAGGTLSQFVEFAESAGATTGQLDVRSDPAGAKVIVDGQAAGIAPLVVQNLSPGEHRVTLEREGATVQHTVIVEPGMTASLVAPLGAPTGVPVSGWIAVSAPFAMQVFEDGRLIGTTETDRIMISAGKHLLQIVNDTVGYRATRSVLVVPGKVAAIGIELPNGTANINALPWAEVWVDNKRIGDTPIGNVSLPLGPHEVLFRHPQFGEKRQAISVTAGAPVLVSVDMRK